jgi:hypothetical protein
VRVRLLHAAKNLASLLWIHRPGLFVVNLLVVRRVWCVPVPTLGQ